MKENMSAALKRQQNNLNITNEDISLGVSGVHMDEDSSYNELKTPIGQPSAIYITPTSNMNLV